MITKSAIDKLRCMAATGQIQEAFSQVRSRDVGYGAPTDLH